MKWSKPRRITPGHYRPPVTKFKGLPKMNMPTVGRVGKMQPQFKKFGSKRG